MSANGSEEAGTRSRHCRSAAESFVLMLDLLQPMELTEVVEVDTALEVLEVLEDVGVMGALGVVEVLGILEVLSVLESVEVLLLLGVGLWEMTLGLGKSMPIATPDSRCDILRLWQTSVLMTVTGVSEILLSLLAEP